MQNFKDYFHMSPNINDNFYRLKQQAILEAQLLEAKKKKEKKAVKDYDGDGKVESGSEEYLGSRSNAIKKAIAAKKGKKVEENYLPELSDADLVEIILEEVFDENDLNLLEALIIEKKKWIQKAIKKEGALRKTMKTKKGETIPVSELKKAAQKGGKTGKRARLALTLRKLNEAKGGLPPEMLADLFVKNSTEGYEPEDAAMYTPLPPEIHRQILPHVEDEVLMIGQGGRIPEGANVQKHINDLTKAIKILDSAGHGNHPAAHFLDKIRDHLHYN